LFQLHEWSVEDCPAVIAEEVSSEGEGDVEEEDEGEEEEDVEERSSSPTSDDQGKFLPLAFAFGFKNCLLVQERAEIYFTSVYTVIYQMMKMI